MKQMKIIYSELINPISRFFFLIINLSKFRSITTQSAHEQVIRVRVIASSGARWDGRYTSIIIYADAEGSRAFGRIIHSLTKLCACVFISALIPRIRTEKRARRWRAACPLTDDDGMLDGEDGTGDAE